ncbi:MAG: radical SAM protein [Deltaproteobacteria bacterium]|nr:radical SAM protein [Deltaproteobacteria bacterium]
MAAADALPIPGKHGRRERLEALVPDVTRTRVQRLWAHASLLIKYATPARVANALLNEYEYRRRRDVLSSYPPTMTIDITNACQLECPLCATGNKSAARAKGVMPLPQFEDMLDQVAERAFQVFLYSWGEPTLVPRLPQYIAAVKRRRLGCVFSSNLSRPLSEAEAEAIVAAGPDRIIVSLDGTTAETHARYRVGSDINVVRGNVQKLRAARERQGRGYPRLVWQFLAFAHNHHQLREAHSLVRPWGFDTLEVERPNLPFGVDDEALAREWFAPEHELRLHGAPDVKDNIGKVCFWPWRVAVLAPDGGLSTCCYVEGDKLDVDNARTRGFFTAWNSPKMAAVRRGVASGHDVPAPCVDCSAAYPQGRPGK